ncbi:GCN5-like N-acetyltransferase [Striga asiatica]|uniref:GCN5-like N-acetyltransferase n=1 Tax=Striga asiatica TaxID=4170 RepID=A0A5A7PEF1_STRAF|nr:GCN5-like N-acetyltransferase [Striga asiatica]
MDSISSQQKQGMEALIPLWDRPSGVEIQKERRRTMKVEMVGVIRELQMCRKIGLGERGVRMACHALLKEKEPLDESFQMGGEEGRWVGKTIIESITWEGRRV